MQKNSAKECMNKKPFNGILLNKCFISKEQKAKQRELDMECQRHNSEAVIKGLNDKLKEKDKEHRCDSHF